MNHHRLKHRAVVKRSARKNIGGKSVPGPVSTVVPSLECWAEGVSPKNRSMIIGKAEDARYILTWSDARVKHNDTITMVKPPLGDFEVTSVQFDVQGNYWTGILEERK